MTDTSDATVDATVPKPSVSDSNVSDWVSTVDTVFPHHANPLGTLFGGRVLELMDVNASVACSRFCRLPAVTASTEAVDFHNPIFVGEIVELRSRVAWTGRTSMIVRCEVYGENPLTGERRLCTIGHMNFVAIGPGGRPTPVPGLRVESELEREHWNAASKVREAIDLRRKA
ncbi:MAG: acyl-CoA thioesterase [Deinococcota bacterium]|nr:acyl-CoA thioesterase [Deinococcota bacterium]